MTKNRFNKQQPSGVTQPESVKDQTKMPESQEQQNAGTESQENTEVVSQETTQNSGTEATQETPQENPGAEQVANDTPPAEEEQVEKAPEVKAEATDKLSKEGFAPVYKVELELTQYAEHMDRTKTIDPVEGGKWQYSLFTLVKSILNADNQEVFNKEWATLLNFFNKNKEGIFNDNFIFRFPEQWPGSATEFTQFRRLIYTAIHTADPKTRKKNLAEIAIETVAEGMNQNQRNKLISFYG